MQAGGASATFEIPDLTDPATWLAGVPHDAFDQLRRTAPVSWHERPTGNYWSLVRHRDVTAVSRDREHFTSTKGIYYPPIPELAALQNDMLIFIDPPRHTRLRALVSKSFTPRVVEQLDGWVRQVVREVLDRVREQPRFDLIEEFASEVPAQVIASMMGVQDEDRPRFKAWARAIFARETPGGQEPFVEANLALAQFALELREQKRRSPGEDLTTALVDARDADGSLITDGEYQQFIWLLLMAGYETSHTMIGQTMRLMLESPDVDRQVREAAQAPERLRLCVEELLRFVTPISHFGRHATSDVEVGGETIREGDFVVLWYAAANRDPEAFEDPHAFRAARSPNRHMAFGGGGVHHCLGKHVARMEVSIVLEELQRSGVRLQLAGDLERGPSCMVNQLVRLPVEHVA